MIGFPGVALYTRGSRYTTTFTWSLAPEPSVAVAVMMASPGATGTSATTLVSVPSSFAASITIISTTSGLELVHLATAFDAFRG